MKLRPVSRVAVLVIAACSALLPVTEAAAHTDLVSSAPASGAVLDSAPLSVVLTFNEDLLAASAKASILDASGDLIAEPQALVDGSVVTISWPEGLGAGSFEVAYRVASGDGHPITGTLPFSFTAPIEAASESARATEPATEPAVEPTDEAAAAPMSAPAATPNGFSPNPLFIAGLLIVAALVGGVIAVRRGRR